MRVSVYVGCANVSGAVCSILRAPSISGLALLPHYSGVLLAAEQSSPVPNWRTTKTKGKSILWWETFSLHNGCNQDYLFPNVVIKKEICMIIGSKLICSSCFILLNEVKIFMLQDHCVPYLLPPFHHPYPVDPQILLILPFESWLYFYPSQFHNGQ